MLNELRSCVLGELVPKLPRVRHTSIRLETRSNQVSRFKRDLYVSVFNMNSKTKEIISDAIA
jgi:hypothetical protein